MNADKIYAEHIANEYSVKKESKVIALKKLDRKAKLPADIFVYSNGIIMCLILGLGMCLSMNVIGNGKFVGLGIIIGIFGLIGVITNLTFIKDNKNVFKASFNNPKGMDVLNRYNSIKTYILNPILERFNIAEKDRSYLIAFYINGIMAIIKEWINNNCKDSIIEVEDIIIKCVGVN